MLGALFRTTWHIVQYLFHELRLFLHAYWIPLMRYIIAPPRYPVADFHHNIVIMGDDHALGVGDWVTPGEHSGAVGRLRTLVDPSRANARGVAKHSWGAMNRGVAKSTTTDWVPGVGKWYEWAFAMPKDPAKAEEVAKQRAKDVVVVVAGAEDARQGIEPADTVRNLQRIVEKLAKTHAAVYVCTVPNWMLGDAHDMLRAVPGEGAGKRALPSGLDKAPEDVDVRNMTPEARVLKATVETNRLIREWIAGLDTKTTNVRLGAELDRGNPEYRLARLYFADLLHFSSKGYEKMAKDLFLLLETQVRKIEFQEERQRLR
ncbi:hypothetical protein GGF32_001322 [Allomyces javanicus]|nr:hypothetical protein GGF32_001322 [Allomyces javanicus]